MFGFVFQILQAVVVGVIVILAVNFLTSELGLGADPLRDPVIDQHRAAVREWATEDQSEKRRERAATTSPEARRRRLDNLLRKIAKEGMGALTREERQFLECASLEFTYKKDKRT